MIPASLPSHLLRVSLILLTGAVLLANGPMGGGGSGGSPQQGGQGPMIPPDLSVPPMGNNSGDSVPEVTGPVPYPPSGPDRTTTLIDQIDQIGKASEEKARKCENIRRQIEEYEAYNGASHLTHADETYADEDQRSLDRYAAMTPAQLDQQILAYEIASGGLPGIKDRRDFDTKIARLKEIKRLRERYGTGSVYQNAIRDTDWARSIQDVKEQAALRRRDEDASTLRDLKAEFDDLGCSSYRP